MRFCTGHFYKDLDNLQQLWDMIENYAAVKMTDFQLVEFANSLPDHIKEEVHEIGMNNDTDFRDQIIGHLSIQLTGMSWPMYGDTEEYRKNWEKKYSEGIKHNGYEELQ